jgi:hypothetical protein
MYRDKTSVQYELYDFAGKNWSHRNSNERFKEKFGRHTRKTFHRFTNKRQLYWEHHTNT